MKNLKKAVSLLMITVLAVSSLCVNACAETAIQLKNKTWSMSSHGATTSNITADFEWDDLAIAATTDRVITFDSSYMKTSGAANVVKFKVAAPCTIKITAKNNSTGTVRYAILKDVYNNAELGKLELPTTQADASGTYSYTGLGGELSITPNGGGISIKSISVEYTAANNKKGDINGDKCINIKDAAMVLRHLSGAAKIDSTVELAAANANNNGSVDMRDAIWILNNQYEETTETTTLEDIDTSDGTVVSSYSALVSAASVANAKVYITADIEMGDMLQLSKGGVSLIGVPDENGVLPVLNFENMTGKNDIINSSSSDSDVGIRVRSANNTIKNLVIEKAHDNGIQIKGTEATGNVVENCIVRYNNDSGIQVTGGAANTTLKGIYSYRNCDVYTRGGNADGFAVKLSAGPETTDDTEVMKANGNFMTDCYAWENGDDGWDSFDYPSSNSDVSGNKQTAPDKWTYWNEYTNCMGWSNGDPANCMGYNDYVNGLALDEDLPFIRRFKAVYPDEYSSFVTSYNNGTLCSRTASVSTYYGKLDALFPTINTDKGEYPPSEIAVTYWAGNPNCFKLGSAYTESNSQRYLTNCISFDHNANGVDRNNSKAIIYANNVISFNNKINYHLSGYTAKEWNNIYGWNGTSSDTLPSGGSSPSSSGSADKETVIRSAAERLVGYAGDNKVVASNVFENVF